MWLNPTPQPQSVGQHIFQKQPQRYNPCLLTLTTTNGKVHSCLQYGAFGSCFTPTTAKVLTSPCLRCGAWRLPYTLNRKGGVYLSCRVVSGGCPTHLQPQSVRLPCRCGAWRLPYTPTTAKCPTLFLRCGAWRLPCTYNRKGWDNTPFTYNRKGVTLQLKPQRVLNLTYGSYTKQVRTPNKRLTSNKRQQ